MVVFLAFGMAVSFAFGLDFSRGFTTGVSSFVLGIFLCGSSSSGNCSFAVSAGGFTEARKHSGGHEAAISMSNWNYAAMPSVLLQ